jgi:hypothetical protein
MDECCARLCPARLCGLAVGADEVATALQAECAKRGLSIELVRNSSRGLFWLETLVEVQTPPAAWLTGRWRLKTCRVCLTLAC